METVKGVEVVRTYPDKDICDLLCVTHDRALARRIEVASNFCWDGPRERVDLSSLDFLLPSGKGASPALIVSHPHGKPKKITVGELTDRNFTHVGYNAATCPGSSGAPVLFGIISNLWLYPDWFVPIHSGGFCTYSTNLLARFMDKLRGRKPKLDQHNYGNRFLMDDYIEKFRFINTTYSSCWK
ncbi:hypothetical protein EGW08_011355 [Elysia chlorotica]|uniref:Peptidase S1 domain-containing protein n=1 Tax=Elysia chlorotica TaxID=188477 RepID=A0A3S1C273_ELYCH|nr:hypothetical protein EGW08_011355 [Elysia chlorotica]